jgi:hypothetical protein
MSEDLTNRTMIGLSPFRPDDEPAEAQPELPVGRSTGDAPVVAPVSLADDDGWDLPEVAVQTPAAPAVPAAAVPAIAADDEAASLRGGTMMLSALAFQEAMAAADANEGGARKPQPTLPEPQPAATAADPPRPGTVRLNAVDFERLMTTGGRPATLDEAAESEISKHALGADDLTDARLAMPARPASPGSAAAPTPTPSVADRVADRRAAESVRVPPAKAPTGNRALVWVVAGGLCAVLALVAGLFWLFVLNR